MEVLSSITDAARKQNIETATAAARIKVLEEDLDTKLLDRRERVVCPPPIPVNQGVFRARVLRH